MPVSCAGSFNKHSDVHVLFCAVTKEENTMESRTVNLSHHFKKHQNGIY